ncbi:MAG: Fic family protein [Acidobacteriota bacterium]
MSCSQVADILQRALTVCKQAAYIQVVTRRPPILMARPLYEWINRVAQKHKHFLALDLDSDARKMIQHRIESDFVLSALRLEGADVNESEIARAISESIEPSGSSESERAIAEQLASLRAIRSLAQQNDMLTPESLLRMRCAQEFRASEGATDRAIRPEHLIASIESACFWFSAESFLELNPVEQAAIALLRLVELQPFDDRNHSTALAAASLFLLRSHLPPVIIREDHVSPYHAAILESRRSDTRPMVELIAEATERTLAEMIALVSARG